MRNEGAVPVGRGLLARLDRIVWWVLAALTAVMSLAMFVQVVCRLLLGTAIVWAEELAVLLFAWSIFLGAAYTQGTDSHLSIDTLRSMVPPPVGQVMDAFRLVLIAGCSLVAIWQGVNLARRTAPLLYPAMEISRSWLYVSVPICFTIGLLYMAADLRRRFR